MSTLPAPAHLCPTCLAPCEITREPRKLPCSHVAFITERGVVVGAADWVGSALNLERVLSSWEAAPLAGVRHAATSARMAERMEQHADGVAMWREKALAESELADK